MPSQRLGFCKELCHPLPLPSFRVRTLSSTPAGTCVFTSLHARLCLCMTQIDPTRVREDAEFKQAHHAQISHSLTHVDGGKRYRVE